MIGAFCQSCQRVTGHKRALGWGTFFAVVLTAGLWLLAVRFYPKRCFICGTLPSESPVPENVVVATSHAPLLSMRDRRVGQLFVILMAMLWLGGQIATIALTYRVVGSSFDARQAVGLVLTALLFVFLYRGFSWARWACMALSFSTVLVDLWDVSKFVFDPSHTIRLLTVFYIVVFILFGLALAFSGRVVSFLKAQAWARHEKKRGV